MEKQYFAADENIILIGHGVLFSILMSQYQKVADIKDLFLKRGGTAKFSRIKKDWEFIE